MDQQDNQELHDLHDDNHWIDEILETPPQSDEIMPDEAAIASAGLTDPAQLEVEKIIQETLAKIAEEEAQNSLVPQPEPELPPEEFKDEEYRDAFMDTAELENIFAANELPSVPAEEPEEETLEITEIQPDELTEVEAEEEIVEEEKLPERKRRPRRMGKDNIFGLSHVLATFVWLAIIVCVGVSLANILWVCASDVLAFGREDKKVVVDIDDRDSITDISLKLQEAGLIRYPKLFSMYAQLTGARQEISAGTYTLNTMYDYHALVNFMNTDSAERQVVSVVIPEGYNCAQIFALLEEKGVCSAADLESHAIDGELDEYWFLEDVKRGDRYCLEGFLFPDTYEFYIDDEPRRVLEKMLDDFEYRFSDELRGSLITLNRKLTEWMEYDGYSQEYIDEHQLTVRELVIIASLIEKETANNLESYTISSVIYNRLYNWGDTPAFLNIDAAIIYALGEHKEELTVSDLQIDSPYNTYTNIGLTPGPICNPGLYSLNAALDPDDTDYYYYAMDPDTEAHHFSESEYEHNQFLESIEDE